MGVIPRSVLKQLALIVVVTTNSGTYGEETSARDPRIIVLPYSPPPTRVPEPYSYPGPSPPVVPPTSSYPSGSSSSRPYDYSGFPSPGPPPARIPEGYNMALTSSPPRTPDPYPMYILPSSAAYRPQQMPDFQYLPKWCKSMWERDECGMRCWMLRKICRNMNKRITAEINKHDENKPDTETSPSISYPYLKPFSQHYYYKKPQSGVVYSKTGLPNTYYAQPSWPSSPFSYYPYYKKHPYYSYKYSSPVTNEFGLNPQFAYIEGHEKLPIRSSTDKVPNVNDDDDVDDEDEGLTTTTEASTTKTTTTTTEESAKNETKPIKKKMKPSKLKGAYPVKVTYSYPKDSEVTTLSPLMFEYDQYSNRGYYGDRIYMSAVLPVSDRQYRSADSADYDSFDDFDEMMIEP